jgi:hypothetical protein
MVGAFDRALLAEALRAVGAKTMTTVLDCLDVAVLVQMHGLEPKSNSKSRV